MSDSTSANADHDNLALLAIPDPPRLLPMAGGAVKRLLLLISSPAVALAIAVLAWFVPNPTVATVLWVSLSIPLLIIVMLIARYWYAVRKYHYGIMDRFLRLRSAILNLGGIKDTGLSDDFRMKISGITDYSGTVQLVIDEASSACLSNGSELSVVVTDTREEWGTVRVVNFVKGLARTEVLDRKSPDFWEFLEDRMKRDPSPPQGFHLEPLGLKRLAELMRGQA